MVMYSSVHPRTKRLRRQGFSGRNSRPPWGFQENPLNLDRVNSGDYYVHPLNLDWDIWHSGDDCGHIHWDLFWHMDFMFSG